MQGSRFPKGKALHFRIASISFILLAFFSAVFLDYIDWKKGEESFLFSAFEKKKEAVPREKVLDQIILNQITSYGISSDSRHHYKDKNGVSHLMVDIPLKKFTELESYLDKEFEKEKISIKRKEKQEGEEKNFYLWKLEGEKKQRMSILFSCSKEKLEKEEKPVRIAPRNKVAIIIDDMGYSLKAINEVCLVNQPLTVAVLPFSSLALETAQIAHKNNLEVLLHLPLESINTQGGNNDMEGIIHSRMSKEEILKTVDRDLAQVPFIRGVNNHMGSKITANEILMNIILKRLKERNLFFIDSLTTGRSVAYKVAKELGVRTAQRHVFLDSYDTNSNNPEEYIKGKMLELFRMAQQNGEALGICHPSEQTLKVLRENFHLAENYNLEPVFASQLVK